MEFPWIRFYDKDVPKTLIYPDLTLPDVLNKTVADFPDFVALTFNKQDLTYREVNRKVNAFAHALIDIGIKKGDRVSLLLPNSPTYVIAFYGIMKVGAIVVNLNVMSQGHDLVRFLCHSESKMVITLDLFVENILRIAVETPVKHIVIHSVFAKEKELDIPAKTSPLLIFSDLVSSHSTDEPVSKTTAEDIAVLQYTSGITGSPKAAVLTQKSITANLRQIDAWNPILRQKNEAIICIIPFFHVFGMTICMHLSIYRAYRMILLPMFDWSSIIEILNVIKEYNPISFPAVPALWAALVCCTDAVKYGLTDIDIATGGGAPMPKWIQEKYYKLTGKTITQAYGLSEASSTVLLTPFYSGKISDSVGIPIPDTEVKIVDAETGEHECRVGEIGELIVKGPQLMQGYWRDDVKTKETIRNGWLYTGDLGRMNKKGFFYLVDRKDDLIITNGYNVYPSEVESTLIKHPDVKDIAVIGVPDLVRGQAIVAFIIPADGSTPNRKNLIAFSKQHLPDYKIPRFYKFRTEIPKSRIGKPIRRMLRDEYKRLSNGNSA